MGQIVPKPEPKIYGCWSRSRSSYFRYLELEPEI